MMAVPSVKAKLAPKMTRRKDQQGISTSLEPKVTTQQEEGITASIDSNKYVITKESVNDNEQNTPLVNKEKLSETNLLSRKLRKPIKLTAPRPMKDKTEAQAVPDELNAGVAGDDTPDELNAGVAGDDTPAVSTQIKRKSAISNLTTNKTQERKIPVAEFIRTTSTQKKDIVEGSFKKADELDLIKLLNPKLLQAIKYCGFIHPSPIQIKCLPAACTGHDLLCQEKSGTGKTLVFVLAVLQQIAPRDGDIAALVMCPTRELAMQIGHQFKELMKHIPDTKVAVFFGGVPVMKDKMILKENCPHIVVGTPGRVLDLVLSKCLPLENVKHFILDECDKMIENIEMRQDVQKVYVKTPREKQVMMFSATMNDDVKNVGRKFMRNQIEVIVEDDTKLALKNIQQFFILIEGPQKRWQLVELLNNLYYKKVFVFVKTVARCDDVALFLKEKHFNAKPIHGVMKQEDRIANYEEFEKLPRRILVATKVFGRGMDIADGNVVINYDMTENTDDYIHRVGRGGRFGKEAVSISFVTKGMDEIILKQVEERFGIKIQPFD